MPTLNIGGRKVTVGDEFLKLSPDAQNDAVDEIAQSLGVKGSATPASAPARDEAPTAPASAASRPQVQSFDAMGVPTGGMEEAAPISAMGYGDSMANAGDSLIGGAVRVARGVPFADRGAAALRSVARGTRYADEFAALRSASDRDKEQNPGLALAGNMAGGALVPFGLMGNVVKGATLFPKFVNGVATGTGIGAAQGISEARDLTDFSDVAKHAGIGAAAGMAVGGSVPVVGAGLGAGYRMAAPFFSRAVPELDRTTTGLLANALSQHSSDALDRLGPKRC